MMPQKEIRKHLIWTVPSGAFREDFVYLIAWYTNGNVIVHGMVTWEAERGFESLCCQIQIQLQNSRWDKFNYMHPVKSLEKTDGAEEGFHCGIVKLRNQETKMCLFAVHLTGLSVFQAQCFEHNALRHNVCTSILPGWNPCWLWDVPHSFPVASTLGCSARRITDLRLYEWLPWILILDVIGNFVRKCLCVSIRLVVCMPGLSGQVAVRLIRK